MKIIKISLYKLFLLLFMTSCSVDDKDLDRQLKIFGTWNSKSFIANEPLFDINGDRTNSLELLEELPCRYSKLILNLDFTFYQENNTWSYNDDLASYDCTNENDISSVSGTWDINSDFTLITFDIDGNKSFLDIEFNGETLQFNSSEIFINKNAQGEAKNIYGRVFYKRN